MQSQPTKHKKKEDGQDDGACGSGDRKEGSVDNNTQGAKCSVIADAYNARESGEKRRLLGLKEGEGKVLKKKKVSEVKGKLQI